MASSYAAISARSPVAAACAAGLTGAAETAAGSLAVGVAVRVDGAAADDEARVAELTPLAGAAGAACCLLERQPAAAVDRSDRQQPKRRAPGHERSVGHQRLLLGDEREVRATAYGRQLDGTPSTVAQMRLR